MSSIAHGDALCFVLARNRTKEIIYSALNRFIPGYQILPGDYAFNLSVDQEFEKEDDILNFLENHKTIEGTLYWNKRHDNSDWIMLGAHFTQDGSLVLSLTISSDGIKEEKYLEELMKNLASDVGVISYNTLPPFENGNDFKRRYGSN